MTGIGRPLLYMAFHTASCLTESCARAKSAWQIIRCVLNSLHCSTMLLATMITSMHWYPFQTTIEQLSGTPVVRMPTQKSPASCKSAWLNTLQNSSTTICLKNLFFCSVTLVWGEELPRPPATIT